MRLTLVTLAWCGCHALGPSTTPSYADRAVVDDAVRIWRDEGYPYHTECVGDLQQMRITSAPEGDRRELCGGHLPDGCYRRTDGPGRGVAMMTYGDELSRRQQRRLIVHESLHWLLDCSGMMADGDPLHRLRPVWWHLQREIKAKVAP